MLEAIEQRAWPEVPVDSRVERGRTLSRRPARGDRPTEERATKRLVVAAPPQRPQRGVASRPTSRGCSTMLRARSSSSARTATTGSTNAARRRLRRAGGERSLTRRDSCGSDGGTTADHPPPANARPGSVAASARPGPRRPGGHHGAGIGVLTLGALGVVFGDIGTSPLYALQTCLHADRHAVRPTRRRTSTACSRSCSGRSRSSSRSSTSSFIMRADNDGEGGIMALIALDPARRGAAARRAGRAGRARHLRRGAVLRRRHDHAGDLGALGRRGPRGRRAGARLAGRADHARRS